MSAINESLRLATESLAGRRPYQEDSFFADHLDDGRLLVAVADGMGGHAAGDVASALALETLVAELNAGTGLAEAVQRANRAVHTASQEPGRHGMGTTLVAALVDEGEILFANVGDSRGFLLTGREIRQVTKDHSFVQEAIDAGQDAEAARNSQWKDALTRSIGNNPEVEVDTFGPIPVTENTAVLLCSDGLYKTLEHDDIRRIFVESGGPRGAVQSLASSAFERGSDDNITVVVAEFGEVPRDRQEGTVPIEFEPPPEPDPPAPDSREASEALDTPLRKLKKWFTGE